MHPSYRRFAAMVATSTVVMLGLMYSTVLRFDHVRWSQTRFWMALFMGAAMAIIGYAEWERRGAGAARVRSTGGHGARPTRVRSRRVCSHSGAWRVGRQESPAQDQATPDWRRLR